MTCLQQAGRKGCGGAPGPGGRTLWILRFAQNDALLKLGRVAAMFESVQGVLGGGWGWTTTSVGIKNDTSL